MKNIIAMILILIGSVAFAQSARWHKRKKHARLIRTINHQAKPSVGTDFYFNAVTVRGHYESPDGSIVTVEDDKKLGDLLDYRTNYKNRLAALDDDSDTTPKRGEE